MATVSDDVYVGESYSMIDVVTELPIVQVKKTKTDIKLGVLQADHGIVCNGDLEVNGSMLSTGLLNGVTPLELSRLSGVQNNVQQQLDGKIGSGMSIMNEKITLFKSNDTEHVMVLQNNDQRDT